MRRNAAAALLVAALGGCMSFQSGPETGGGGSVPHWGKSYGPPAVPGVKGPHGENIAMAAPYDSSPPASAYQARQMMAQSVPMSAVQMNNPAAGMYPGGVPPGGMMPTTAIPRGPMLSPPGFPFGPGAPAGPNVPGGSPMLPGMMPGMGRGGMLPTGGVQPANMPMGGGVINANIPPGSMPQGGVMQAQMMQANAAAGVRFQGQRTQIRFVRPSGMRVSWFTQGPDGNPAFSSTPIEAPGRYNFPQAAIYRLKLSNIEGRPGLEIYPTMEVVPCNPKTEAFLAHSAVPVEFTNEDFKQIAEGNYLVKVIYLPDPQFQDVAGTGTDEILSTRLEPGADPIQEALRRGSILVVLRMGNVDQEAPNTPPLNAPGPNAGMMMPPPGAGHPAPGFQVPMWGMKTSMPGPGMKPGVNPTMNRAPLGAMPGPLNISSVPLPGSAPQGAAGPGSANTSFPGAGSMPPGTSSTTKFQNAPARTPDAAPALPSPPPPDMPPMPPTVSVPQDIPAAPPALPQNNGPAFPPTPENMQPPPLPGPG